MPRTSIARAYLEALVVAIIVALFIRTFLFQAFKIPSGSMEPSLLVGDHVLVNRFALAPAPTPAERALLPARAVRRGAIVIFKYPPEPDRDLVKRVIGLPGETIELAGTQVLVNGRPIEEPYARFAVTPATSTAEAREVTEVDVRRKYGPVTVPAGHVFVLGDNRDNSRDSRYWGYLPLDHIKGRVLVIYWSFVTDATGARRPGLLGPTRWSRILSAPR